MNESSDSNSETRNIGPAKDSAHVVREFELAWQRALAGGPTPRLQSFLESVAQPDRNALRQSLETIQQEYQKRLTADDLEAGGTVLEPQAKGNMTVAASHEATMAYVPGAPTNQAPTVKLQPGPPPAAATDAQANLVPVAAAEPQAATLNLNPGLTSPASSDATAQWVPGIAEKRLDPTMMLGPGANRSDASDMTAPLGLITDDAGLSPTINLDPRAATPPSPDRTANLGTPAGTANLSPTINLDGRAQTDQPDRTIALDDDEESFTLRESEGPEKEKLPTVEGYKILGVLGRGGMGVVYRARQTKLDRIVALKMVIAGAHAGSEQLSRFYTEAQAVAHLQHPNIVQIYEVGEREELPYFSLEYVEGGSLAQKCAGKPLPDADAARMVELLARAMHHAHEHNIVHRDLKPANVLLTADGAPKITDFGLAKRLEGDSSSQTRSGSILGTPSYMAPEQALGEVHQIGPLTDVWALGAILYELVTGRPPFLASNPMDTVMQVVREEPVAPVQLQPKVARDLETICLKCLQKEQTKRYPNAVTLAEDLRRFQIGEPISARPVGVAERVWRWCRRNPRVASLTAAVVALVFLGIIGLAVGNVQISRQRNTAIAEKKRAENNEQLAKAEQKRAEIAEEDAMASAELAGEQAEIAIDALKTVVTEVDKQLKDRPRLRAVRAKLLEMALAKFELVTSSEESATTIDRGRAQAFMQKAYIYLQLGQPAKAKEQQEQAHAILLRLVESNPQGEDADKGRGNLAVSFDLLADFIKSKDPESARPYYLKAQALRQDLKDHPATEFYKPHELEHFLANSWDRLGDVALRMNDLDEALSCHKKSWELRGENLAIAPNDAELQQSLANTLTFLATVHRHLGDYASARTSQTAAVEWRKKLALLDPLSESYKRDVPVACRGLGDIELYANEPEAAATSYSETVNLYKELLKIDNDPGYQQSLAGAYYRLGTAVLKWKGPEPADEHYQAALQMLDSLLARGLRVTLSVKKQRMLYMARCGKHTEAAKLAEDVSFEEPQDENLLEAACGFALCISAVAHLKPVNKLSDEERSLQEQYIKQAMDKLERAVDKGYKDLVRLERDPDLDPLRSTSEFTGFLQRLKGAVGSGNSQP